MMLRLHSLLLIPLLPVLLLFDPATLPLLLNSFPTRRSSDLPSLHQLQLVLALMQASVLLQVWLSVLQQLQTTALSQEHTTKLQPHSHFVFPLLLELKLTAPATLPLLLRS